jgi:hypothetical protein
VRTVAADVAWISALPVTFEQWASFVRSEEFFNDTHWLHAPRPAGEGDTLLARVGYRWRDRHRGVVNVTWDEAQAFSRYSKGRLPWLAEWQAFAAAVDALTRSQTKVLQSWLPADCRGTFGYTRVFEWCGDVYHRTVLGPHARAESPLRRRLSGGPNCMVPSSHHAHLGFRVAFEDTHFPCATRVADWAVIELPSPTRDPSSAVARAVECPGEWGTRCF